MTATPTVDTNLLSTLRWRSIGPHRGGRVCRGRRPPDGAGNVLLRGVRRGSVEVGRRRDLLAEYLGRLLHFRSRRGHRRIDVRPGRHICGHGRGLHEGQRLSGGRRLPLYGRGTELVARGPGSDQTHLSR